MIAPSESVANFSAEPGAQSSSEARPLSVKAALLIGVIAGVGAAALTVFLTHHAAFNAVRPDFDQVWFGAKMAFQGRDPYPLVGPRNVFEWPWGLTYPATAFILAAPFAILPLELARAAFIALGIGLFAYGLARVRPHLLPLLVSYPVYHAVSRCQWSPYIAASLFLPAVGIVFCAKPTIGAAVWLARPTRWAPIAGLGIFLLSFMLVPGWLPEFIAAARTSQFAALAARPSGVLLLCVLLRWRRAEARMLAALALIPQSPFPYEATYAMLVSGTRTQALMFAVASWAVYIADATFLQGVSYSRMFSAHIGLSIIFFYLPAVVLVLRRPNVSTPFVTAFPRARP